MKEPREGAVRLIWNTDNWVIEKFTKNIVDPKTKQSRSGWQFWGYYGSNLKLAATEALKAGCEDADGWKQVLAKLGESVKEIKKCVKEATK